MKLSIFLLFPSLVESCSTDTQVYAQPSGADSYWELATITQETSTTFKVLWSTSANVVDCEATCLRSHAQVRENCGSGVPSSCRSCDIVKTDEAAQANKKSDESDGESAMSTTTIIAMLGGALALLCAILLLSTSGVCGRNAEKHGVPVTETDPSLRANTDANASVFVKMRRASTASVDSVWGVGGRRGSISIPVKSITQLKEARSSASLSSQSSGRAGSGSQGVAKAAVGTPRTPRSQMTPRQREMLGNSSKSRSAQVGTGSRSMGPSRPAGTESQTPRKLDEIDNRSIQTLSTMDSHNSGYKTQTGVV